MNVVFVTQGFPIVALVLLSIKIDAPVYWFGATNVHDDGLILYLLTKKKRKKEKEKRNSSCELW